MVTSVSSANNSLFSFKLDAMRVVTVDGSTIYMTVERGMYGSQQANAEPFYLLFSSGPKRFAGSGT